MITAADDNKRYIHVTDGNIRNSHLSVTGLHDFLPVDCVGGSRLAATACHAVLIELDGLAKSIETDIGRDARTGKPRHHFRSRGWVKEFFCRHGVSAGDVLELERTGQRSYRLRVAPEHGRKPGNFRAIEFFAGIGLVRLALEKHGIKVMFANDIDPAKLEMYRANFGVADFHLGDIHQLLSQDLPDCELVTASFPCTDLSIAGEMKGINSGESSAFWGLIRLLREMSERRPHTIMLENVPGFLMAHGGQDFESALLALNELGYAVDAFMLNAAAFVPQSRLRMFVVGKLGAEPRGPLGVPHSPLRPDPLLAFMAGHEHIVWSLRDLPAPPKRRLCLNEIIEDLPQDDPAWWGQERASYFMGQLSERHSNAAQKMIDGPNPVRHSDCTHFQSR